MAKEYGITAIRSIAGTQSSHYEMGWKFRANSDFNISGLRVYLPNAQTVTCNLWTSGGALLASTTIAATAGAWCEALFADDVSITSGEYYVVTCYNTSNRYWASSSNLSFNSKVSYQNGVYGNSKGVFPTSTESGRIYPFVDVVIGRDEFKPTGSAIVTISNYRAGGNDRIEMTATTPAGTSVAVSTSVNQGSWQNVSSGGAIAGLPAAGQTCNLRIKIDLATTNLVKTPSVTGMTIYADDDVKKLLLTLPVPNISSAVGDVTVNYDGLGGLQGTGGPVASFNGVFTPAGMTWKGNQNDEEHFSLTTGANVTLTTITYYNTKGPDEHVEFTTTAAVVLTNIHDL